MRYYNRLRCCCLFIALWLMICGFRKDELGSWKEKQLVRPEVLAARIQNGDTANLLILNTGPVENITGAVSVGAMEVPGSLAKLKACLDTVARSKEIVIYCGCCPLAVCPNLRPACDLLKEMKFTSYKVLRLPTELKDDWIDKGYPMPR